MNISAKEQAFLERNQLPPAYLDAAKQWFSPIVDSIVAEYNHNKTPRVIGINGCQGSGKSTLADYLCTAVSEKKGDPKPANPCANEIYPNPNPNRNPNPLAIRVPTCSHRLCAQSWLFRHTNLPQYSSRAHTQ